MGMYVCVCCVCAFMYTCKYICICVYLCKAYFKKQERLTDQNRGYLWKKDANVSFLNLMVDTMITAIIFFKYISQMYI